MSNILSSDRRICCCGNFIAVSAADAPAVAVDAADTTDTADTITASMSAGMSTAILSF